MLLPVQTAGVRLQNRANGMLHRGGVRPALPRAGGGDCPDGTISCSCGTTSMCCDAYSEYCWTDGNGDCWCIAKPDPTGLTSVFGVGARHVFGR
jgi:hypothetical protein